VGTQAQTPAWAPPIGIPAPPFGIVEQAGPATVTVPAGGTNPATLAAGAVVQLSPGTYGGRTTITCSGTAAAPAYLRGPATLTGSTTITGGYCIFEKLTWSLNNGNDGPVTIVAPSHHVVVRHSEVTNPGLTRAAAGIGLGDWGRGGTNADVVIDANRIHHIGNRNAAGDVDGHGIGVGLAQRLWVLDNTLESNSGDGIQINGGIDTRAALAAVHHVYVGRNTSFDNKQNGFWTKTASDVVFSRNVAHSHRPSPSSPDGAGFGFQYDPQRVWFIGNESYRNTSGFTTGSGNNGGRRDVYLLGNVFHDNERVGVRFNDGVAGDWVMAHNTVVGSPVGFQNGYYASSPVISSNVVAAKTPYDWEGGGGTPTLRSNVTAPPRFAPGTYRPAAGSPAIDAGRPEAAVYARHTYGGPSITVDRDGAVRPMGSAWDAGAYEYAPAARPPSDPAPRHR
jgi:hypothetical protein